MLYGSMINKLKRWFLQEKRDFPWREEPTPYGVWVSEVMLQQTQASVVVPYFLRWMERFPTIESLAQANLDEVIKLWEGLGYYSRARNLHEGAKFILSAFKGQLPDSYDELSKIKGLGPYTIGAILSFAFHKKIEAVDGNVVRVLSRFYGIEDDIAKPKTLSMMRQQAFALLPDDEPWVVNEALIELGATVCMRKPLCSKCPLKGNCQAFRLGKTDLIPYKSKKTKIEKLVRAVAIVKAGDALLVRKGQDGEIMQGLYEFPYFELSEESPEEWLTGKVEEQWSAKLQRVQVLDTVSHSFTRFQVTLKPILFRSTVQFDAETFQWITFQQLQKLAFSSGHRRIFQSLNCYFSELS